MHALIKTVKDPKLRVKVVEERTLFDVDPQLWINKYQNQQDIIKNRIIEARKLISLVKISDDFKLKISQVCSELDVDGLRGDIVTNRAAKAYAAFQGKREVDIEDISKIITLFLRHRLRKDPLESIDSGYKVKKVFNTIFEID
jgi:magnesium chelatase subunit I